MLEGRENSEKQRLMLIDFEYSSYNYRCAAAPGGGWQPGPRPRELRTVLAACGGAGSGLGLFWAGGGQVAVTDQNAESGVCRLQRSED